MIDSILNCLIGITGGIFIETDNIEDLFHIIAQNIKIECLNCLIEINC